MPGGASVWEPPVPIDWAPTERYHSRQGFVMKACFLCLLLMLSVPAFATILSADQFPGSDIGAKINNAVAALPLNSASKPFGTIKLGSGAYSFSSPIVINSPYVTLDCQNSRLTFTGSGSAITLSDAPTTYAGKGGIHNCHIFGNGGAGQIGITLNEVTWSKLQSVEVNNFSGSGSIGILFSNTSGSGTGFTENNELDDVQVIFNKVGIAFQDNCSGSCPSFAYNHFYHVDISIPNGATAGVLLQNDASLNGGDYDIRCRGDGTHGITCMSLLNTSSINLTKLNIGGENGAGTTNTGISTAAGTLFAPVNLYEQWFGGTFNDSFAPNTFVAYIYTPPSVGHLQGAAQGLSIGNTSNGFLATLSSTSLSAGRIFTLPDVSGTFVVDGATQTLSNKTLTSPIINEPNLLITATAPTISSGFGTSPAVTGNNGTAAFTVNVGSGGTATTGILAMPTAANGWNCQINDVTAAAANVAYNTRQTASSINTVTVQNQTTSTSAAVAWGANDILGMSCFAY
jgi:hypothetical protein